MRRHSLAFSAALAFAVPAALVAASLLLGACATPTTRSGLRSDAADAQNRVESAVGAVDRMKREPVAAALLERAKGVLVVPDYGKAAWIVGGQGGAGVLLVQRDGRWSDPAFYSLGGVSVGLQAGGAAGPIALLLMTDKAIDSFETRTTTWSLGASAGLTVVNTSAHAGIVGTTPPADVVVWTGTKGLFGGISFGATDITPNGSLNDAYYHRLVTATQILSGEVTTPEAAPLREALAAQVAAR